MPINYSNKRKTRDQTNKFVNYEPNFFTQEKTVRPRKTTDKKKGIVKLRKTKKVSGIAAKFRVLTWHKDKEYHEKRVEAVRSFKAIPQPDKEFWQALVRENLKMKRPFQYVEDLLLHMERNWSSFCEDARATLTANLQPGDVKFGYKLNLGRYPWAVMDRLFSMNTQCKKEVVESSMDINRETVPYRLFKYSFMLETGFPSLDTDMMWWVNLHFPNEKKKDLQMSRYTALTVVCSDYDNRVYCNWEMQSFTMWIDPDKKQGKWLKTV